MAKKVNREETRNQVRLEQQKFVDENKHILSVSSLVKIVGISRASYYKFKQKKFNINFLFNELLKKYILKCHNNYKGIYGRLRIKRWLEKKYGIVINHKRVYRLMKELNIKSVIRKKRLKRKYKSPEIVRTNKINRKFTAKNLNEKWSIDVSYIPISNRKFKYLFAIKDLFNGEIVDYSIENSQTLSQVNRTLERALKGKEVKNLTIHSDQGFQFTHKSYISMLEKQGVKVSHSRRGNCIDNSPIESFFGHLKSEFKYLYSPNTDIEIVEAIKKYIKFYNEERIQLKLKGYSPKEYRTIAS